LPAWFMHRSYHVSRVPSLNRKIRVIVDWSLALLLRREVVSMGELHSPREPFTDVTPTVAAAPAPPVAVPAVAPRQPAPSEQAGSNQEPVAARPAGG
jgi:NADH dehydrogenase